MVTLIKKDRYLFMLEKKTIFREIHKGYVVCNDEEMSIVQNILNQGYYWLTMTQTTINMVLKCESRHRYTPRMRHPLVYLFNIRATRSFAQWRIDILGPLPRSIQHTYIIVAINYFSK